MWKKIIAFLLLLIGGVLMFSNQITDQVISQQTQQTVKEALAVTPQEIRQNTEETLPGPLEEALFDFSQVEAINPSDTWQTILDRLRREEPASVGETTVPASGVESTLPGPTVTQGSDPGVPSTGSGTRPSGTRDTGSSTRPASTLTEEQAREEIKKFSQKYIIGIIKVPAIKLELGILKGVLNRNLYLGVGTMRKDQVMGSGNYPLAGHHTQSYGVMFNRVPELKAGQLMYVTDKETIYTYRVYERKKVHESDVYVIYDQIAQQRGKPVLTLATCFNLREPEARVIVHGELMDSQPYTEAAFAALK